MKKFYALFLFLIAGLSINANPIALPTIEISELYFDESNNWKLELGYFYINPKGYTFDSIFLYSSMDTARIPDYFLTGEIGQLVLTPDSLTTNFRINRLGDTIKVISYAFGGDFEDILIFGDVSGASINYPRIGQSLSKYGYFYVKDNSPTIGEANDTAGIMGTLKGIVYSQNLEPVNNKILALDSYFQTSENGEFSTRMYSKPSSFNRIAQKTGEHGAHLIPISYISYTMEPDSVIVRDVYLQDSLVSSINNIMERNSPVKIYPNPISKNKELKIIIDLPIMTSDICIEIIDINGKIILKKKISQNSSSIIVPDKSGFYIVRTMLDSEIISSNRIIVNE